jgi:hypothetical protein
MGERRGRHAWWSHLAVALAMLAGGVVGFQLTRDTPAADPPAVAALAASVQQGPATTAGPPAPVPTTTTTVPPGGCHPSYQQTCIPPAVADADCFGAGGNGPWIVRDENVRVVGEDVFALDVDFDGIACVATPGLHGAGT